LNEIIKVNLETITPLWTGDAWGENTEIKPQSIMGALRFWFEVYCYAVGIPVKNYGNEQLNFNKFQKSLKSKLKEEIDLDEAEDMVLAEQGISLPSRIFGCTGWRGQIEIKDIYAKKDENFEDYQQGKLSIAGHNRWFFPKKDEWFFGNIEITFASKQVIIKSIIIPLLNLIQRYGFIGGRNNLGYGRVNFFIDSQNIEERVFEFSYFRKKHKGNLIKFGDNSISNVLEETTNFSQLLSCKKIGLLKCKRDNNSASLKKIIEFLVEYKATQRVTLKNRNVRHYKFGSTYHDKYYANNIRDEAHKITGPNATKIVPWINKIDESKYEYGFLSLVGLQNFGFKIQEIMDLKEKNDEL